MSFSKKKRSNQLQKQYRKSHKTFLFLHVIKCSSLSLFFHAHNYSERARAECISRGISFSLSLSLNGMENGNFEWKHMRHDNKRFNVFYSIFTLSINMKTSKHCFDRKFRLFHYVQFAFQMRCSLVQRTLNGSADFLSLS